MAELSLQGHEAALKELADESRMTDDRLSMHITELEKTWSSALEQKIGRQAEAAAHLLAYFTFEQMTRSGASSEDIRDAVALYKP